jgi:hypothetical protein
MGKKIKCKKAKAKVCVRKGRKIECKIKKIKVCRAK